MAVPFPRSIRSLKADSFRYTLIGLAIASVLLLAWGHWFFGTEVTLYQHSKRAYSQDQLIIGEFPSDKLRGIRLGQRALFYPEDDADAIAVIVSEIRRDADSGQPSRVVFVAQQNRYVTDGTTGRVEIAVAKLSPAQLLLQQSGLIPANTVTVQR